MIKYIAILLLMSAFAWAIGLTVVGFICALGLSLLVFVLYCIGYHRLKEIMDMGKGDK